MSSAMTDCAARPGGCAMRHDPASAAIVIMMRSLKTYGMAQAVEDLVERPRRSALAHKVHRDGVHGLKDSDQCRLGSEGETA